MKRFIAANLMIIVLMSLMPAMAFGAEKAPFTLLVYMNGSDLESDGGAATSDLEEMMTIGSTESVNVLVETGGTQQWFLDGIANNKIQRWYVSQDVMYLDEELPNANMGDSNTLASFIQWGVETYPAESYGLIFWNHGSGAVYGYGSDENYNDDTLLLHELETALEDAYTVTGTTFELIGFDACLMASIETAAVIAPYGNYLTASEELEPGHGWDYTAILNTLNKTPSASGATIGKAIVDSFQQHARYNETDASITLSVTDLSQITPVETALDALSTQMNRGLKTGQTAPILMARASAESYGEEGEGTGSSDMVDLYDFAVNLQKLYPTEARNLMAALQNAVLYSQSGALCPEAKGLSAYFPLKDKPMISEKAEVYDNVPFSSTYRSLISDVSTALVSDTTGVDFEGSIAQVAADQFGEITNDYFEIQVDPSNIDAIEQAYFVLGELLDESNLETKILGVMPSIELDQYNGLLRAYYVDGWETLGDQFVTMYLLQEEDSFAEYTIPAFLNNERVNIHVIYDQTSDGRIIGARRVTEGKVPDRDFITLKIGDTLQLIYDVESNDGFSTVYGTPFRYNGQELIGWEYLPLGDYTYQFYIRDVYQNETYSDFVIVSYYEEESNEGAAVRMELPIGNPWVTLNSATTQLDVPAQIISGRSMMPIRFVAENLGATVGWDAETKTVQIENSDTIILLPVGSTSCTLNGDTVQLDVPAQIVEGRTLMPIRFIAESLGATVEWNAETQTVIIVK